MAEGEVVVRVHGDAAQAVRVAEAAVGTIALGMPRTLPQDVAFGIDQLADIALRALSPGINDPTTSREAPAAPGPRRTPPPASPCSTPSRASSP